METPNADINGLYDAMTELRQHTDQGIADLRQHTEKRIADLEAHTDNGLAGLRASLDAHRWETSANMRWMIGLTLVNTSMVLGLSGRIFGLY